MSPDGKIVFTKAADVQVFDAASGTVRKIEKKIRRVVGLALWASRIKLNQTTDSYLTSSPTHRLTGSRAHGSPCSG